MKNLTKKMAQFKQWILSIVISRYIKFLSDKYCSDKGDFIALTSDKNKEFDIWLLDKNESWLHIGSNNDL